MKKTSNRDPAQVRAAMTAFCLREFGQLRDAETAYISALTSAAHLCDQIASEAKTQARMDASKACGDFIWAIANAVKAERTNLEAKAAGTK